MSTDWRALCAELLDHAECAQSNLGPDGEGLWDGDEDEGLFARARAALAQPEPEVGPTDEELEALADQFWVENSINFEAEHYAFARAVLARWGHQPAPPAEGEVGELIEGLNLISDGMDAMGHESDSWFVARAADLLERQAAPVLEPALARINDILNDSGRIFQTDEMEALDLARQALEQRQAAPAPVLVAVAEQWPEFSDCDRADDRVWCFNPVLSHWKLSRINRTIHSHWLPATALPLPSGEVQP